MNYTFDTKLKTIRSVWILDVSYRIFRYQQSLPELAARMQRRAQTLSIWRVKYWKSVAANAVLVFYCLPEVHLYGIWIRSLRFLTYVGHDLKPAEQAIRNAYGNVRKSLEQGEVAGMERGVKSRILRRVMLLNRQEDINSLAAILGRAEALDREAENWMDAIKTVTSGPLNNMQDKKTAHEALTFVSLVYHLGVIRDSFQEARMVVQDAPSESATVPKAE